MDNPDRQASMGRLKAIGGRLSALPSRVKRHTDAEGHDASTQAWRAWYASRRWKALRWATLVRDSFTCQCGCGVTESDTSRLVADHRREHRGDPVLFWDPDNLWTLRADPCHNRIKQREEAGRRHAPAP